jgi:hypothetical protein
MAEVHSHITSELLAGSFCLASPSSDDAFHLLAQLAYHVLFPARGKRRVEHASSAYTARARARSQMAASGCRRLDV